MKTFFEWLSVNEADSHRRAPILHKPGEKFGSPAAHYVHAKDSEPSQPQATHQTQVTQQRDTSLDNFNISYPLTKTYKQLVGMAVSEDIKSLQSQQEKNFQKQDNHIIEMLDIAIRKARMFLRNVNETIPADNDLASAHRRAQEIFQSIVGEDKGPLPNLREFTRKPWTNLPGKLVQAAENVRTILVAAKTSSARRKIQQLLDQGMSPEQIKQQLNA